MSLQDNTNQEPDIVENEELVEAPQIGEEITQLAAANDEVSKALVTLEALALSIESAPALTAMEARIVNASIERLNVQFQLPISGLGLEAASDPRQAALEDVSSKIETFKKTIAAIIDKMIELVKKFYEWLTLNAKTIKKRLQYLQSKLKGREGSFELPVNNSFNMVVNEDGLTAASAIDVGATLFDLMPRIAKFLDATSPKDYRDATSNGVLRHIASELGEFSNKDGTFTFYKNIANRSLQMAIDPDILPSGSTLVKMPYQARIVPAEGKKELPSTFTIDQKELSELIGGAIAVLDTSQATLTHINGVVASLKSVAKDANSAVKYGLDEKRREYGAAMRVMVSAYSKAINVFIDGVYTQSMRYSSAVANIGAAYIKHGASNVVDNV